MSRHVFYAEGNTLSDLAHHFEILCGIARFQFSVARFSFEAAPVTMRACKEGKCTMYEQSNPLTFCTKIATNYILTTRVSLMCCGFSQNLITDNGYNLFGYGPSKPDMGQPMRTLLRPGDAIIAHQRLGHAGGINLHERTRKNLYFRVHHRKHDEFLQQILEGCSVFTEFEGIHDMVGNL